MNTFEVGTTYWTRSLCDHECIHRATVLSRTPKSVKVEVDGDKPVMRRVQVYNGNETFQPFGSYSMAATISAEHRA